MASLKTDSPVSRRIARSFLHFLNSVESSAGVDIEALYVAKDCLAEIFKIDQFSIDGQSNCDSLVDIFLSSGANAGCVVGNGGVSEASGSLEMQKAGCETFELKILAETFKSQGNKAMQSKRYSEAIELYTFAIALCEDNAVYYCNRSGQSSTSTGQFGVGSRSTSAPLPSPSMPFNINGGSLPSDFSSMIMNMSGNAFPGQDFHSRPDGESEASGAHDNDTGVRVDGNMTFNVVNELPEELPGAFRSMMGMFSGGAAPNDSQQDNSNGRSTAS